MIRKFLYQELLFLEPNQVEKVHYFKILSDLISYQEDLELSLEDLYNSDLYTWIQVNEIIIKDILMENLTQYLKETAHRENILIFQL